MQTNRTILSAFALHPVRAGGIETDARELSVQLAEIGWESVLVFLSPPTGEAKKLFDLPNIRVEVIERCGIRSWATTCSMAKLLADVRPRIMHLHFMDGWTGYPWLAKRYSVERIFITDHNSRPIGHRAKPTSSWKVAIKRIVHFPVTKVFCVSDFVSRCVQEERTLPENWERRAGFRGRATMSPQTAWTQ